MSNALAQLISDETIIARTMSDGNLQSNFTERQVHCMKCEYYNLKADYNRRIYHAVV
jgi:hypothetical protein